MIGRGTRLCPHLFGPGNHKDHFQVFDFCQNLEFFNQNPKNLAERGTAESLAKQLFASRVHLVGKLDEVVSEGKHDEQPTCLIEGWLLRWADCRNGCQAKGAT